MYLSFIKCSQMALQFALHFAVTVRPELTCAQHEQQHIPPGQHRELTNRTCDAGLHCTANQKESCKFLGRHGMHVHLLGCQEYLHFCCCSCKRATSSGSSCFRCRGGCVVLCVGRSSSLRNIVAQLRRFQTLALCKLTVH